MKRHVRARLSRQLEYVDSLQHAARERVDLVLFRQHLSPGEAALRFDLLYWNLHFHPHDAGEPFILSAQLLSNNFLTQGEMKTRKGQLDLYKIKVPIYTLATRRITSRRRVGVHRLELFGGAGNVRAGRLRPHRRRRQSAGGGSTSTGRAAPGGHVGGVGRARGRASRLLVAGLVGLDPKPSTTAPCPGARAGWRSDGTRSRTRRAATVKVQA